MKSMDVQKLWRTTGLLLVVLLVSGQALARDGRNLAVNQINNAVSEQRIALVIGNGAYTSSPLKNPVNDAKDIAAKLRGLGFNVIERNNLQTRQIGATLREFRSKLVPGAVALVFYAGHGLQIKGINYLPAVDAEINSEEDVPNQSIAMNQIMDVLDEAKTRLNLVFLDACRNNPYARSFRSADKGLARVSAPSGTLISYATRPGSVAADGGGRNGLYTSKLLAQMDSHLQIEQALKRVVTEVKAASQGKQEPWMEGSIEGDFCFAGCAASGGTQVTSLQPVPAPVGGSVALDDIKKNQEVRAQWDKWQQAMKADFDKIVALNAEPDLQVAAWDRFLANYTQKNPFSEADEQLRAQAQNKKQAAQAQQQQKTDVTTPKNKDFASLLEKAQSGDAQSQYELAVIYDEGINKYIDQTRAFEWYRKAATQGHIVAQVTLARKLATASSMRAFSKSYQLHGKAEMDDEAIKEKDKADKVAAKAFPELKKLAQRGDSDAQLELGMMYRQGRGAKEDEGMADQLLEASATQGNLVAQRVLGGSKIFQWTQKAALQGSARAQSSLGLMYFEGKNVTKDVDKAIEWFEKAALHGDVLAKAYYEAVSGVLKDDVKAFKWSEKLAMQGDTEAQTELGGLYLKGTGVAKNDAKAFEWFEQAAQGGNAKAQFMMCISDSDGKVVTKDRTKTFEWCQKSASQGADYAQAELGRRYYFGIGTAMNKTKGFEWYEKAALQGNGYSQRMLGAMYALGSGVKKDAVLGYAWLNLAASHGGDGAKEIEETRDSIKLTASQIAEAERLSSEWKPGNPMRREK